MFNFWTVLTLNVPNVRFILNFCLVNKGKAGWVNKGKAGTGWHDKPQCKMRGKKQIPPTIGSVDVIVDDNLMCMCCTKGSKSQKIEALQHVATPNMKDHLHPFECPSVHTIDEPSEHAAAMPLRTECVQQKDQPRLLLALLVRVLQRVVLVEVDVKRCLPWAHSDWLLSTLSICQQKITAQRQGSGVLYVRSNPLEIIR